MTNTTFLSRRWWRLGLLLSAFLASLSLFGQGRSVLGEQLSEGASKLLSEVVPLLNPPPPRPGEPAPKPSPEMLRRGLQRISEFTPVRGSWDDAFVNLLSIQFWFTLEEQNKAVDNVLRVIEARKHFTEEEIARYGTLLVFLLEQNERRPDAERWLRTLLPEFTKVTEEVLQLQRYQIAFLLEGKRSEEALAAARNLLAMVVEPKREDYEMFMAAAFDVAQNAADKKDEEDRAVAAGQNITRTVTDVQLSQLWGNVIGALEVLLSRNPDNAQLWEQLMGVHIRNNQDMMGMLVTLERAQERGLLNDRRYQDQRIRAYFALEQYRRAVELLENGMETGALDAAERGNWELLAYMYSLLKETERSISTLERAADLHGWPEIFVTLGQTFQQRAEHARAVEAYRKALATPGTTLKVGDINFRIALSLIELKQFEDAKAAIAKAREHVGSANESTELARRLNDAQTFIDRTLEREARLRELEQRGAR